MQDSTLDNYRIDGIFGNGVSKIDKWVRTVVDPLKGDRTLTEECEKLSESILNGELTDIFGLSLIHI